jgi:hypothetical protein
VPDFFFLLNVVGLATPFVGDLRPSTAVVGDMRPSKNRLGGFVPMVSFNPFYGGCWHPLPVRNVGLVDPFPVVVIVAPN